MAAKDSSFHGQRSTGYTDFYAYSQQEIQIESSAVAASDGEIRNNENDFQINLSQLYMDMQDNEINIERRMEIFNKIKEDLRIGKLSFERLAPYHAHFCALQARNFSTRPGIGVLNTGTEAMLVPALKFLREGLYMGEKTLVSVTIKSDLLPQLAKMVMTFAERTDLMSKNLSKMCAVDSLLGHTRVIPPYDVLNCLLDVLQIPESVAKTNVVKIADLQHRYDCECVDCKDNPNKQKRPSSNPLMLHSGATGTIVYPLRSLPRHLAALCPVNDYWTLLEARSKKITESVTQLPSRGRSYEMKYRNRNRQVFVPGQQVIVSTECLVWLGYEATSPTAPKLPLYLRGFVIGECPLPIQNPHIGLWLPDYASQALCYGDKLTILPELSKLRILPPLLFLAKACPPTPDEAIEVAVDVIFLLLLKNARLDQIRILLDDKGPWRTVQMLNFLKGEPRAKFLSIVNKMTKDFERGSRSVVACCLHNLLADWAIWSTYTQPMSEFEQETLMEGLIQTIPRIDVRKWPRRPILLQAVHALLRDAPTGNLQTLLKKCKEILSWDPTNRGANRRGGGNFGPWRTWENRRSDYQGDYRDRDRNLCNREPYDHDQVKEEKAKEEDHVQNSNNQPNQDDDRDEQGMLRHSEYNIGRRPRPGETWYSVTSATLSMVVPNPTEPTPYLPIIQKKMGTMIRSMLYKPAQQGRNCELIQANSLRDVKQPMLARLMCGMLNSGGGKIYIGLGAKGLVQGVYAPRPERDSFTQGVVDVTIYNLDPRLPPYAFKLERRMVIKSDDNFPEGDWNRYVFILDLEADPEIVYQVLPDKQSYVRRPQDGVTVLMVAPTKSPDFETTSKE